MLGPDRIRIESEGRPWEGQLCYGVGNLASTYMSDEFVPGGHFSSTILKSTNFVCKR